MRAHHRRLLDALSAQVERLEREGAASADLPGLVALLTGDLLPHALGEERHLYPVVDELIRRYGRPTAPMSIEHQHIEGYIDAIQEATEALETASDTERPAVEARLKRLARELRGIVQVHQEKEERVFLPLVEKYLPQAEQEKLIHGMHHSYRTE